MPVPYSFFKIKKPPYKFQIRPDPDLRALTVLSCPQSPSLPEAPGLNTLQIKRFLHARTLDYEETQADLRLQLPRYLFNASLSAADLIVHEESIGVTSVSVNKRTGSFVVPELAIVGTWGELETLLTAWFHNRNARRTEARRGKPSFFELLILSLSAIFEDLY